MIFLNYCLRSGFNEVRLFDYLNDVNENEPTDLDAEAEELCLDFIETNLADGEGFVAEEETTKCDGFNELKSRIKNYVYLKRHTPVIYRRLENTYRQR